MTADTTWRVSCGQSQHRQAEHRAFGGKVIAYRADDRGAPLEHRMERSDGGLAYIHRRRAS